MRIPIWVKIGYTLFMCVLVPHYLRAYGPTNFLYFCDIALFMTLVAVWTETPLLVSAPAVGIFFPQFFWMFDFFGNLVGHPITGMATYMFDSALPLFARFLSFFHFWLPIFLFWLISRLGYDRRAMRVWWVIAWIAMIISYLFLPPPPAPPDNPGLPTNVNYVYNVGGNKVQTLVHPHLYFIWIMGFMPLCIFWPTHRFLCWVFPEPTSKENPIKEALRNE
ncbi:MAG: hypothetical protein WA705_23260 [Candidatus Ozemobacteraceae bacterium]